jgi:hypothetical protein
MTREGLTTIPREIVSGQIFFQRFCVVHCRVRTAAKKFHFFCCLGARVFGKIAENKAWTARGPTSLRAAPFKIF